MLNPISRRHFWWSSFRCGMTYGSSSNFAGVKFRSCIWIWATFQWKYRFLFPFPRTYCLFTVSYRSFNPLDTTTSWSRSFPKCSWHAEHCLTRESHNRNGDTMYCPTAGLCVGECWCISCDWANEIHDGCCCCCCCCCWRCRCCCSF